MCHFGTFCHFLRKAQKVTLFPPWVQAFWPKTAENGRFRPFFTVFFDRFRDPFDPCFRFNYQCFRARLRARKRPKMTENRHFRSFSYISGLCPEMYTVSSLGGGGFGRFGRFDRFGTTSSRCIHLEEVGPPKVPFFGTFGGPGRAGQDLSKPLLKQQGFGRFDRFWPFWPFSVT